jgi:hypothetical protein
MRNVCSTVILCLCATLFTHRPVAAQVLPPCSWPLETSVDSLLNVAYPDTNAIYWTMPIDTSRWRGMIITGRFPASRFMSFTSYDTHGAAIEGLLDYQIRPDQGSRNPFDPGKAAAAGGAGVSGDLYTVVVDQGSRAPKGGNHLQLGAGLGWVIYRIYVPDAGQNQQGGVDLPSVTLLGHDGSLHPLAPCPKRDLASMAQNYPEAAAAIEAIIAAAGSSGGSEATTCAPDQVAFAIPSVTGGYFPNPANKYIAAPSLCYQPERVIVVRGKAATFPDTYNGQPVWQPPGQFAKLDLRYWSLCNNNQEKPYPVVQCAADYQTGLDDQGYYTYIVSEPEPGAAVGQPPDWLPAGATWLPWGSKTAPNILLFRNMIPSPSFHQSVQDALAAGCTFDNSTTPVPYAEIATASACAQTVMGPYHPSAVYCDKALLIAQGWQACFSAAGVSLP